MESCDDAKENRRFPQLAGEFEGFACDVMRSHFATTLLVGESFGFAYGLIREATM